MEKKIFETLNKIGVPGNINGRRYIETALDIINKKDDILLTKELYPQIAKLFNATVSRVERSIRYAIEVSFDVADFEDLYGVFGNVINLRSDKLTNGQFLFGLMKYIKRNSMEE